MNDIMKKCFSAALAAVLALFPAGPGPRPGPAPPQAEVRAAASARPGAPPPAAADPAPAAAAARAPGLRPSSRVERFVRRSPEGSESEQFLRLTAQLLRQGLPPLK